MQTKTTTPKMVGEELFATVRRLCEKEGKPGWKLAQRTMLKSTSRNRNLQEAMEYAMCQYRPDYFRPALLAFSCEAVGGDKETTVSIGAALTLFAWAIGIHDDIIDQSRTKDGHLTIHGKFGKDLALILSDVLLFKGFGLLRERLESDTSTRVHRIVEILETVEKIWFEQSEGEAFEIQHRGVVDVTPKDCLAKIRMRASEIDACARIGAILGGGTLEQVERLGRYGRMVGMMGILRNEVIDMLEPEALRQRIRRESLPLPLVYALQETAMRPRLIRLMTQSRMGREELTAMSRISDESRGIERTARLIDGMIGKAYDYAKSFKNRKLEMLASPFRISPEEWKKSLAN